MTDYFDDFDDADFEALDAVCAQYTAASSQQPAIPPPIPHHTGTFSSGDGRQARR